MSVASPVDRPSVTPEQLGVIEYISASYPSLTQLADGHKVSELASEFYNARLLNRSSAIAFDCVDELFGIIAEHTTKPRKALRGLYKAAIDASGYSANGEAFDWARDRLAQQGFAGWLAAKVCLIGSPLERSDSP